MRIGACFATFAILSYTKIIDNNWYLRHLFSYFLFGIQWVTLSMTNRTSFTITTPIAFSRCWAGVVSDYGDARLSFGFNHDKLVCHGPGLSTPTACNIIMIGI